MDNRLEIRSSRLKNIIFSLLSALMTSMALLMLLAGLFGGRRFYGDRILYNIYIFLDSIFRILIGLFGTLFFGAATLFYIKNIFVNKPTLIINNDGFYENTSISGYGEITINMNQIKDMDGEELTEIMEEYRKNRRKRKS